MNNGSIRSILVSCFTALFFLLNAQNRAIDSLKELLLAENRDSLKVDILNDLSNQLRKAGDNGSAKVMADKAVIISKKVKYRKGLGDAFGNLGMILRYLGDYPQSLKEQFNAL